MRLPIRIGEEAEAEMAQAARWYERHREGLGLEFIAAVDRTLRLIEDNPRIGSPTPQTSDKAIRRHPVRRFPYHIVYLELDDRLHILAIAHDRRRPGYWRARLQ